jgi:Fe-S-cluster-containing dehydrogenase component
MRRWNLIIDLAKCEDCNNCFLACKDEHVANDWPGYAAAQPLHGQRWINIMRKERGTCPTIDVTYRPTPCMHCDDAPCIRAATGGAAYKRADGVVLIDPQKAAGQRALVDACPYGAIYWNEEKNLPQKCTLCAHLLDEGWQKPRCAQSCPTGALTAVRAEDEEIAARVLAEGLRVLQPERGTRPRVYYKNLYLFDSAFVAGSVSHKKDGLVECVEGAQVSLRRAGAAPAETLTDCFGDFRFDGLACDGPAYALVVSFAGCEKAVDVEVKGESVCLGELALF